MTAFIFHFSDLGYKTQFLSNELTKYNLES
jgi:hypothetical protein